MNKASVPELQYFLCDTSIIYAHGSIQVCSAFSPKPTSKTQKLNLFDYYTLTALHCLLRSLLRSLLDLSSLLLCFLFANCYANAMLCSSAFRSGVLAVAPWQMWHRLKKEFSGQIFKVDSTCAARHGPPVKSVRFLDIRRQPGGVELQTPPASHPKFEAVQNSDRCTVQVYHFKKDIKHIEIILIIKYYY